MTTHDCLSRTMLAAALLMGAGAVASRAEEAKTDPEQVLKARATQPAEADIDKAVSLTALLEKKGKGDWSPKKGGVVEGYVVRVWKSPDGDRHVILAEKSGEADHGKWVVGEVKPAWQKKTPDFSDAKLDALLGKKVRITGWLFFDTKNPPPSPHGTPWEIHPITAIAVQP